MPSIQTYRDAEHGSAVMDLWRQVFGYETAHNEPGLALARKLAVNDGLLFVAIEAGAVVGTAMAGYDGHRGWLYSVAVAPSARRRGVGSALVRHAEHALSKLGCLKINLQLLASNEATSAFYRGLGYAVEPRISMGKVLHENVSAAAGRPDLQLSAARVFVRDLAAAKAFYEDKLGLPLKADGSSFGYCVFQAGVADLIVESVPADAPEDEQNLVGRFTGLSFAVADAIAAHQKLQDLGVRFTGTPQKQLWGGILATLQDSAGNELQIVQYPAAG